VNEDDLHVIAMSAGALTLELCAVFCFAVAIEPMHYNPAKMLRQARSHDGFPATLAVRHEDQAALKVDVLPPQMQDALSFPSLYMPAISSDDHHSAVNPHETMQRLLAFALECYFPIVAFTSSSHFRLRLHS
jgi:hypothetical protein